MGGDLLRQLPGLASNYKVDSGTGQTVSFSQYATSLPLRPLFANSNRIIHCQFYAIGGVLVVLGPGRFIAYASALAASSATIRIYNQVMTGKGMTAFAMGLMSILGYWPFSTTTVFAMGASLQVVWPYTWMVTAGVMNFASFGYWSKRENIRKHMRHCSNILGCEDAISLNASCAYPFPTAIWVR